MNEFRLTTISEVEEKAYKMPLPDFIEVSEQLKIADFTQVKSSSLALTWQLFLAGISSAVTHQNYANKELIYPLILEIDFFQLHKNAINDVCAITQQSYDANILVEVEAKINLIKAALNEYLAQPQNIEVIDVAINELNALIGKLKSLEVVGVGAFAIATSFQLLLLQEKANDSNELLKLKPLALEYSNYAKSVNPRLFRLSIGKIDKICTCKKYKTASEATAYECQYFDGKDIHVFREFSPKVGYECNKHRLTKFHEVAAQVNQISQPVRAAIKKWQELANQLSVIS